MFPIPTRRPFTKSPTLISKNFEQHRIPAQIDIESLRLRAHKNRGGVRVHTNIIPFFVQASELPCIRMKLPVTVS